MSSMEGSLILGNIPEESPANGVNVGKAERIASALIGGALVGYGIKQRSPLSLALALFGGGLLYRGASGECELYRTLGYNTTDQSSSRSDHVARDFHVEKSISINSSPAELYGFWHNLENLTRFMEGLESVTSVGGNRSHWIAQGPGGKNVEWDAEIINQREDEMLAWRSLPGGDVETAGSVHFRPLSRKRGTMLSLSMKYNPPAGKLGAHIASLLGEGLDDRLDEDLMTFKQVMETGMAPAPAVI